MLNCYVMYFTLNGLCPPPESKICRTALKTFVEMKLLHYLGCWFDELQPCSLIHA